MALASVQSAKPKPRRGIGVFLFCASLLPAAAVAGDQEQRLEQLRARIQQLQTNLNELQGRRNTVREELRDLERRIGESLRAQRRLDGRLKAYVRQLAQLRAKAQDERRALVHQAGALERQVRAAHAMGRQEPLKLLLNQEEPARVARAS